MRKARIRGAAVAVSRGAKLGKGFTRKERKAIEKIVRRARRRHKKVSVVMPEKEAKKFEEELKAIEKKEAPKEVVKETPPPPKVTQPIIYVKEGTGEIIGGAFGKGITMSPAFAKKFVKAVEEEQAKQKLRAATGTISPAKVKPTPVYKYMAQQLYPERWLERQKYIAEAKLRAFGEKLKYKVAGTPLEAPAGAITKGMANIIQQMRSAPKGVVSLKTPAPAVYYSPLYEMPSPEYELGAMIGEAAVYYGIGAALTPKIPVYETQMISPEFKAIGVGKRYKYGLKEEVALKFKPSKTLFFEKPKIPEKLVAEFKTAELYPTEEGTIALIKRGKKVFEIPTKTGKFKTITKGLLTKEGKVFAKIKYPIISKEVPTEVFVGKPKITIFKVKGAEEVIGIRRAIGITRGKAIEYGRITKGYVIPLELPKPTQFYKPTGKPKIIDIAKIIKAKKQPIEQIYGTYLIKRGKVIGKEYVSIPEVPKIRTKALENLKKAQSQVQSQILLEKPKVTLKPIPIATKRIPLTIAKPTTVTAGLALTSIGRAIEKSRVKLSEALAIGYKVKPEEKKKVKVRFVTIPKIKPIQKIIQRAKGKIRITPKPIEAIIPVQKIIPREKIPLRPPAHPPAYTTTETVPSYPPPPPLLPPVRFKFPKFFGGKVKRLFAKIPLAKQPKKYQPSLAALSLGIRGLKPKRITGLEIRPILRKRARKKAKISKKKKKKRRKKS